MADVAVLSRDQIMQMYLRDIRFGIPGADTATNSDAWVRATAIADVALPLYSNAVVIGREVFPGTASEPSLKRFATTYGVPKLGDMNASGTATATASVPMVIADGSEATNPSTGARYKTVGATVIPVGLSATCYIVALDPGVGGNCDPGTVLQFTSPPPGLNPVLTVGTVAGGDSAWSNARWAKEILRRMRQAPRAGNVAHFIELGLCIPGVEQTFVYPALRGRGTMDVVLTTSAASGSRVAGTSLLTRYLGALMFGARAQGGEFIPSIPEDVFENTNVSAVVAQPTSVLISAKASTANPFASWPPYGAPYAIPGAETRWYKVSASTSATSFTVDVPGTGTPVAPTAGKVIGLFFPSVGFVKGTIIGVSGGGPWVVTVSGWSDSTPTETSVAPGTVVTPWSTQLPLIAGPAPSGSLQLSGAVPAYFAALGPGEMTPLTSGDTTRRCRWPRTTDTDPLTGSAEWPTDLTARFATAIANATYFADLTADARSGYAKTPDVPIGAYIGAPPYVLTLGTIAVIPTV